MAHVGLERLTKRFGTVTILREMTLSAADGEFLVLVGPSGCGKSTLLRIIAGLEDATGGTVRIGSRDVTHVPPKDRNVAMVFQNYALYPHMTVRENLGFGLTMRRTDPAQVRRRVDEAAALLDIAALLERKPYQLSGGQKQRVAIGRAIVRDPDVFLFDEPLSNLDAKLRLEMRVELKRLHHRLRATVVYVTHDQLEAMSLGDRIVVLHQGVIQQIGAPMDVYRSPANRFVAGFIGVPTMNFLEGRVTRVARRTIFQGAGISFPLPSAWRPLTGAWPEGAVTLGVRPECIRLGAGNARGRHGRARVEVVEPLGQQSLVTVTLAESPLTVQTDGPAAPGTDAGVIFDPDGVHLFDAATGRNLRAVSDAHA